MVSERLKVAERALERAQRNLATAEIELREQRRHEEENWKDPYFDGQTLMFEIEFPDTNTFYTGKKYVYAARRARGRWFTTGPTCPDVGYSWEQLVRFIYATGNLVSNFREVTNSVAIGRRWEARVRGH